MKAALFSFADKSGGARWYAPLSQEPVNTGSQEFYSLLIQQHKLAGKWSARAPAEFFNSCTRLEEQNDLLRQEIARLEEALLGLD